MKTRICLFASAALLSTAAFAQNQYDALRFLQRDLNGTARFVGMGGAMSALGADLSTISTNPAGIGLYRSNDVSLSFGWNSNQAKTDWAGTNTTQKSDKMSFDQAGFVWTTKIGNKTDLRFMNFAFNYQKRANFTRDFMAGGNLNGQSLTNQMANMMWNAGNSYGNAAYITQSDFDALLDADNPYIDYDYIGTPFLGAMGARTGLVDPYPYDPEGLKNEEIQYFYGWDGNDGTYYSREKGVISEYDFNVSFNVKDRYYFGITLGVYNINYSRYSSYAENFVNNEGGFSLDNWAKTEGVGVDLKLGAIIRPFEYSPFRIGLAVHTPIWYSLTDKYTSVLTSDFSSGITYTENLSRYYGEPNYILDYHLISPWRFNVSMGTTFSSVLAVDAEYEYETYNGTRLSDVDDNDFNGTYAIDETLKGVHTFRVGMEVKPIPEFSIRAGYYYKSSPIEDDSFKNIAATDETRTDPEYFNLKSQQAVTFGVGFRSKSIYADIAYKYAFAKADFYAFDSEDLVPAKVDAERNQLLFTIGARF
ncbi:hypothetical protein [uncultured Bacteroides sp.]|uniref:OmpP1/FadL family transporter n=1 Tax=uncultured Bacteroides sp. TaxID=162156 RepID=UPI0026246F3E|nr:hypothetical protein [uncultured Bacteroides sp.]